MQIESEIGQIFGSHQTASYVGKIREIRFLSPDVVLLRAVAGMVQPGGKYINLEVKIIMTKNNLITEPEKQTAGQNKSMKGECNDKE